MGGGCGVLTGLQLQWGGGGGIGRGARRGRARTHLTPALASPPPTPPPPPPPRPGLLSENNRLKELGKILDKFSELLAEQRGEVKATVTTADGLSAEEIGMLQAGLKSVLKPGQTLVLEEKIDPTIIGGARRAWVEGAGMGGGGGE